MKAKAILRNATSGQNKERIPMADSPRNAQLQPDSQQQGSLPYCYERLWSLPPNTEVLLQASQRCCWEFTTKDFTDGTTGKKIPKVSYGSYPLLELHHWAMWRFLSCGKDGRRKEQRGKWRETTSSCAPQPPTKTWSRRSSAAAITKEDGKHATTCPRGRGKEQRGKKFIYI